MGQRTKVFSYMAFINHKGDVGHEMNSFVPFQMEEVERSIVSRFEAQAVQFPDRIAIEADGTALTYQSLNEAANRIARAILARIGSIQKPVGFLVADDFKSVISMLGILKSGNIYVPLDPEHPRSRIARIVEDSEAVLLLTDHRTLAMVEELPGRVDILEFETVSGDARSENPELPLGPDSLAYIVYTSGSTGQPKGVLQTHRNRLLSTMNTTNSLKICAADRISLLSARTSAQAMTNIFAALLNGAAIYPFRMREVGLDNLATWLIQEGITIYHSTSSIFNDFTRTLKGTEQFPKLRVVKLGGEPVTRREFELFKRHFSAGCVFVQSLSSSEVGTYRQWTADHQTEFSGNIVPAGYAVPGVETLLWDEKGKLVRIGEIGEIVVRSCYLTPGYWRRPELNRVAFQHDPGGTDMRLFRTGDLGRFSNDGCLQYLGRKDFQVKIRGNRIELAEVEMALLEITGVAQAVVVADKDKRGDPRLVAYIVPSDGHAPTTSSLRKVLRESLPDYMVPSVFVRLEKLPRTPQGKVDRHALPSANHETSYVAPRNPTEAQLASTWELLLGVGRIGVRDDFFDLGGNSLLAVRLLNSIETDFGRRLPISTFYTASTIEDLAELILQPAGEISSSPVIKVSGSGGRPPFFFLHGDFDGGGIYCLRLARHLGEEQPFYSLRPIVLRGGVLPATIELMAGSYLKVLQSVQPHGPYLLGGFCNAGLIAFEMARQLRARGERVDLVMVIDIPAKNVDFSIHRKLVGICARILRLKPSQELESFIRLRNFVTRYKSLSGLNRAEFILDKAKRFNRILKQTDRRKHPEARQGQSRATTSNGAQPIADDARWEDRRLHYRRMVEGYVVRPCSGHIALLRTNDHTGLGEDPTLGWSRIAPGLEVHAIPGDHASCVVDPDHLAALGEELKSCLDRQFAMTGDKSEGSRSSIPKVARRTGKN